VAGDLLEPGVLEDLAGPHVQLASGDLPARLGAHRVGLQGPGAQPQMIATTARAAVTRTARIMTRRADARAGRLERLERPSETGEGDAAAPAERPTVLSPASPDEPEAAPSATLLPEGAVPELPTDWPGSVPWPPEITAESDTR
jgi:hypothetical protein